MKSTQPAQQNYLKKIHITFSSIDLISPRSYKSSSIKNEVPMKFSLLVLLLSISSSVFASNKTVTISGKAADFLYGRFFDISLGQTKCSGKDSGKPWMGPFKCIMKVSSVFQSQQGKIEVYGPAAEELYGEALRGTTPEESGISCFVAQQTNGTNKVGCELKAKILR